MMSFSLQLTLCQRQQRVPKLPLRHVVLINTLLRYVGEMRSSLSHDLYHHETQTQDGINIVNNQSQKRCLIANYADFLSYLLGHPTSVLSRPYAARRMSAFSFDVKD